LYNSSSLHYNDYINNEDYTMNELQAALDLFYKQDRLAAALEALHAIGKLWHLDDDPYECGFSDEEAAALTEFQLRVWQFAEAEDISPFSFYPTID
jgi:hypothetical protein